MGCMWHKMWHKRCRKAVALSSDDRLPDGDTVLRPGAVRWTALYRSERVHTDTSRLMTPGQEYRTREAPWLNGRGE
jgi:hypothetical protein